MMENIFKRHQELKERIHAFRIPLSSNGQRFMGFVYFTIPIISGYFLMQYVISIADKNIGERGSKLSPTSSSSKSETAAQNKALGDMLSKIKQASNK